MTAALLTMAVTAAGVDIGMVKCKHCADQAVVVVNDLPACWTHREHAMALIVAGVDAIAAARWSEKRPS